MISRQQMRAAFDPINGAACPFRTIDLINMLKPTGVSYAERKMFAIAFVRELIGLKVVYRQRDVHLFTARTPDPEVTVESLLSRLSPQIEQATSAVVKSAASGSTKRATIDEDNDPAWPENDDTVVTPSFLDDSWEELFSSGNPLDYIRRAGRKSGDLIYTA